MARRVSASRATAIALSPAERLVAEHYRALGAVVVLLLAANELALFGLRWRHWDWLLVTGGLLYVWLLPRSLREPEHVALTMERLRRRKSVQPAGDVAGVEAAMHRSASRVAAYTGWLFCPIMLAAWLVAYRSAVWQHAALLVVELLAAVPVGRFIGRSLVYAGLGRRLHQGGVTVQVTPGHLDRAGGLKPVGDLFFFQASMIGAIAAYLGVWWLITPVFFPRYLVWRQSYLELLGIVLACELLAFLAPMWWFHRLLQRSKAELMDSADQVSQQAAEVEEAILAAAPADRDALQDRLTVLENRYRDIEALPTWPVDVSMRRRFTVKNLALFVPIAAGALNTPDSWQQVLDGVSKALSGG